VNYTRKLPRFIVELDIECLPKNAVNTAKKSLLDWIGCALGAVRDPSIKLMADWVGEMGGNEQASILGSGVKTNVLQAALTNGMMAHVLDYDDAQSVVRTHPGAPLVAAVLAVAERDRLSGAHLITSLIAGYEVTIRIGLALGKEYYERGWHATSILGRFGAAAGGGKLLGLDGNQMGCALGLAATQAGGLRDAFGTMAKSFHAGKAAMDGLISASLAYKGFSGPSDILDETAGFAAVFSSQYDVRKITDGLGEAYQILSTSFKPYAACLLVHPVIDALIGLRKEEVSDPLSISEIEITVAPLNIKVTGNPDPVDCLQAKFSLQFVAALALLYGRANETDFTSQTIHDVSVRDLMKRVRLVADASLGETEAHVRILRRDGGARERHVTSPKGEPANPMTFQEIEAKFMDLAEPVIGRKKAERVIETVYGLEDLNDSAKLVYLCCRQTETKSGKR
jgi:2-methylcitrate dehydratase PrpD